MTESFNDFTPEKFIWKQLEPYKGLNQKNILEKITKRKYDNAPKNISKMISDRVVGTDSELSSKNKLFRNFKFSLRNIPIGEGNKPLEKATFHTLKLSDFSTEWDDSEWKHFFEETTFIYIAYNGLKDGLQLENGDRILEKLYKVRFTDKEVEDFGKVYDMIKRAIDEKNISLLPTASSNISSECKIVIAPKSNSAGVYDRFLDDTRETCFMINKDFLQKKFDEGLTLS